MIKIYSNKLMKPLLKYKNLEISLLPELHKILSLGIKKIDERLFLTYNNKSLKIINKENINLYKSNRYDGIDF